MNKIITKYQRGFSIGEVVATLIALGVISLSAQSLILLTKRFTAKQKNTMYSLESGNRFVNHLCTRFQNSSTIQISHTKSYIYNSAGLGTYTKIKQSGEETNIAVLSYPLLSKSNSSFSSPNVSSSNTIYNSNLTHSKVGSFLNGDFKDGYCINTASSGTCTKDTSGLTPTCTEAGGATCSLIQPTKEHIENGCTGSTCISGSQSYTSKFYDVYTDTHTLITYNVSQQDTGNYGGFGQVEASNDGIILATRCIHNKTGVEPTFLNQDYRSGSVIDSTDLKATHTNYSQNETALYILEKMTVRPFYFPKLVTNQDHEKIKCCDIYSSHTISSSSCTDLNEWTPVTYYLRFTSLANPDNQLLSNAKVKSWLSNKGKKSYWNGLSSSTERTTYLNQQKNHYKNELLKKFSIPIQFTEITELPFNNQSRQVNWAYSFIAPNLQHQHDVIRFKWLNIENGCYLSKLASHCPLYARDKLENIKIPGTRPQQTMQGQLSIQSRDCPFRIKSLANTGGAIPMGIIR